MDGLNGGKNGGEGMDEEDEHPSHQQPQLLFQENDGQEHQQPLEVLFLEDEYEQKFQPEEEEEGEWTSLNDQVLEEEKNEGEDEHSLVVDNSIERIEAHKKDVFCLSLSKNERWLATGSEDDTAAVWDANQKPIRQHLHIVGKHVDSVHCLAWNCSSDLLASGDMSGRIVCTLLKDSIEIEPSTLIIEDCQSTSEQQQQKQMLENQEEEEQENSFEHIRWLLWHPSANGILFAGSGDGSIWMWLVILNEANSLNVQQFKIFPNSSNSPCVSGKFLEGAKHFLSVYEEGVTKIWDLKNAVCVSEVNLPGSCTGAMDLHLSGNMAAFGCSNGQIALVTINLIDQKLKLIHVFTTSNKKEEENEEEENNKNNCSVECIKFFPGNFPWLAGGMANGKLIIFNWEHLTGRYEFFNEDEAVIDCFWNINSANASSISLSSICVDGTIRRWDAKNGHLIGKIDGGGDQIYSAIKLKNNVDDGIERILTGCEGGLIRIFELSF